MSAPRLIAITDRRIMGEADVARLARGEVAFLVRERDLGARELRARAASILGHAAGRPVLVSDRLDVARALGIGAALPEAGVSVRDARRFLGPGAILLASRHDLAGALEAARDGADWVSVAPVFETPSKPGVAPLGLEELARIARALAAIGASTRLYALGGIDAARTPAVLAAGAHGIAAIRAAWSGELQKAVETAALSC